MASDAASFEQMVNVALSGRPVAP